MLENQKVRIDKKTIIRHVFNVRAEGDRILGEIRRKGKPVTLYQDGDRWRVREHADMVNFTPLPCVSGKTQHATKGRAMLEIAAANDPDLVAYFHPECQSWHVGHGQETTALARLLKEAKGAS